MQGTRKNLISHLLLIANDQIDASGRIGFGDTVNDVCAAYLQALQHISDLLDPTVAPTTFTTPDSARRFLTRLEGLWTEIVIGGADPQRSEVACDYAHRILVRTPASTAYFVNECARSFAKPQLAIDLLARASHFIKSPAQAKLIERAHTYVMSVVMEHHKLPAAEVPKAISSCATAEVKTTQTPKPEASKNMIMTKSHRAAFETLMATGELFFQPITNATQLKLRLFMLLVGPTGAGKSFLVEKAATELRADYFKVTRGDWLVLGSKVGRPTVFQILDRLLASERLVLHFDELDKFTLDFKTEWSACVGADLWNILDCQFQVQEYLRETKFPSDPAPSILQVQRKIRTCLWIVGSGTWQDVFSKEDSSSSLGFGARHGLGQVSAEAIAKSGSISHELLHRFNSDLVFLNYPSKGETLDLLHSTGISALASELGMSVTVEDVKWTRGGMRVLETIATGLMIEKFRRSKQLRRGELGVKPIAA